MALLWFFVSLYLLGFLTIAGTAYMVGGGKPYPRIATILWGLAIAWLIVTPIAYHYVNDSAEREYIGILIPHRCWSARLLHMRRQEAGTRVEIGDTGTGFVWLKTGPIDIYPDQLGLRLDYDDQGRWIITARILDRSTHRAVVTIDEGKWHVSDKGESWDFNYSDDALEVLNGDQTVALQIRVLPEAIQIQGEGWNEAGTIGKRLVKGRNPDTGQIEGADMTLTPIFDPPEPHIEPMFKYPRQLFLGQTVKPEIDPPLPPNASVAEQDPAMCAAVGIFALGVFSCPFFLLLSWCRDRWNE